MTYGPGQDEDLDQWIAQQAALSSLLEPESQMPAYQAPPHAEMPELKLDTGPDWSDALGAGTTLLASLADLGFNKGRGTGNILAAGGQFAQARGEQRLRQTQEALGYEEKRAALDRQNKYNDYLYANMAQRGQNQAATQVSREGNLEQRKRDIDIKAKNSARADANQDPSELIAWAGKRGYDLSGLETMGQARAALGPLVKEWELEHADEKAQASRAGTLAADVAAAPQTNQVAADKAAGIEEATRGGFIERAKAGAEAREDVTGNIANRNDQQQQTRLNKFRDETEKTRPQIGLARSVEGVMGRYPGDKPGVGMWDSFKNGKLAEQDDLVVRNALNNMTDLVARVRSGAAIPPPEFEKIASFVAGGQGATEQQFRVAWAATVNALKSEMKQQAAGRDSEARMVLDKDADWALGKPAAPTFRATPGGGVGTARGNTVGPVGGMSSGSTGLPRAQPNGDGTFSLPGGKRPYTAQEVQQFIQMGRLAPL